tara:strand:+ start:717 stop:878 length:162 start_codon:yes stop_codon:yes gene_type:complete
MALKYYSAAQKLMADIAIEDNIKLRSLKHLGITKKDVKQWIKYIMEKEHETLP